MNGGRVNHIIQELHDVLFDYMVYDLRAQRTEISVLTATSLHHLLQFGETVQQDARVGVERLH